VNETDSTEKLDTIEHLDEEWPCAGVDCTVPATWVILWSCGKCSDMVCPGHKIFTQANLASLIARRDNLLCERCKIRTDPTKIQFVPM
jgi:hypothetical protein